MATTTKTTSSSFIVGPNTSSSSSSEKSISSSAEVAASVTMDDNNQEESSSWNTVTPGKLADHLWQRFDGDATQILDFVEQTRQAALQQMKKQSNQNNHNNSVAQNEGTESSVHNSNNINSDLGPTLLTENPVVSFLAPRGKVTLYWHANGLRAVDVKTSLENWRLSSENVVQGVIFPKPEDCKKDISKLSSSTSDMVVLHLSHPLQVTGQKKTVAQVAFPLPTTMPVGQETSTASSDNDDSNSDRTTAWLHVLQTMWPNVPFVRVYHPQQQLKHSPLSSSSLPAFSSYTAHGVSTTSAGMPFVSCYHGTSDGVLYPLKDGSLLFYKPALLVPSSDIDGITTGGRGGGAGGSNGGRYVDLIVQCTSNDNTIEFTNLNSDEIEGLQKFLALAGSVGHGGGNTAALEEEEKDDQEETPATMGDYRPRSKRKASAEARRINKRIVVAVPEAEQSDSDDDMEYHAEAADMGHDEDGSESDEESDESDGDHNGQEDDVEDSEEDDDNGEEEIVVHAEAVIDDDATEGDTESEG
jgi:hypothetical protein